MEYKRVYNERWTAQEEADLITARIKLDHVFQSPKTRHEFRSCWEDVTREANLNKPIQFVTYKWQNILKKYKKTIRDQSLFSTSGTQEWHSFEALHNFLKDKTQVRNRKYIKRNSLTSVDDSTTDASISVDDLHLPFDLLSRHTVELHEPESEVSVKYEKFDIDNGEPCSTATDDHNTINSPSDSLLAVVKREDELESIHLNENETTDINNEWGSLMGNLNNENIDAMRSISNAIANRIKEESQMCGPNLANDVINIDDEDEEPNCERLQPVVQMNERFRMRTVLGKRKIFRRPEYLPPKANTPIYTPNEKSIFTPKQHHGYKDFKRNSAIIRSSSGNPMSSKTELQREYPEEDEDRTFLLSLVPSMKRLNGEQKLIVKTEFLKLLSRVTYPNSKATQIVPCCGSGNSG